LKGKETIYNEARLKDLQKKIGEVIIMPDP